MASILPQGGRYSDNLTDELVSSSSPRSKASIPGIHANATVGSTPPLGLAVMAFSSPQRSYVTGDPGYEAGMMAAAKVGARVVKVPLTKSYAHDVKAMIAAAPDAGVFYICNPNNPTGTLTSHSDIEYLVANKPKDSIVLIDEAYIHFTDAPSAVDLVKAGKDVVVLRTFSKVFGMAGIALRIRRSPSPDLMEKVMERGGWNFMPMYRRGGRAPA